MKKIAFIGAGSIVFTYALVRDILTYPSFQDATLALMDIDEERLDAITKCVSRIVEAGKYPAKIVATTNRAEALNGADGVVCSILNSPIEVWRNDLEIPKKHGVDICIGDTRGPAGIFRFLRTVETVLDICRDIERLCPDAVFLNYSNPMAMLCRAMQQKSKVKVTGLCHSVQGTAGELAEWIGAPMDEITYLCAGINHQAFYLEFKRNGKDVYPEIRKAVLEQPEIYRNDKVRCEMLLKLGYFVTESTPHGSEYNWWFRKRQDIIEQYVHTLDANWGKRGVNLENVLGTLRHGKDTWKIEMGKHLAAETVDLSRGHEYASGIFNAVFGDGTLYKFNGNVRNFGIIDNLPVGACVEVPVLASKAGFEPMRVGSIPNQLAALINTNAICEELAVEGALERDPRKIYYAIYNDPLTAATLSLEEIRLMVKEMFEYNREYLPQFKHIE